MAASLIGAFTVVGCAGATQGMDDTHVVGASSAQADETAQPAATQAQLTFSVRAHDGSPLKMAHYSVHTATHREPFAAGQLDADGSAVVDLPAWDRYRVTIDAVDHARKSLAFFVEPSGKVRIAGRLGTYTQDPADKTLALRLAWVVDTEALTTWEADAEQRDGRYVLALTPPEGATKLRYQMKSLVGGRATNSPDGQFFVPDGDGGYWSEVDVPDSGELHIDLDGLPPPGVQSDVVITGADKSNYQRALSKLSALQREVMTTLGSTPEDGKTKSGQATKRRKKGAKKRVEKETPEAFIARVRPEMKRLAGEARARAESIEDTELRKTTIAVVAGFYGQFVDKDLLDIEEVAWVLDELEPTDRAWAEGWAGHFFFAMRDDERARAHLQAIIDENRWTTAVLYAVNAQLRIADADESSGHAEQVYETLVARFPRSQQAFNARRDHDPARPLRVGKQIPEWSLTTLDEPDAQFGSEQLRGKPYLVDIWTVWCGPCVGEMEKLHEAYAKINHVPLRRQPLEKLRAAEQPRVEFVALSCDEAVETVTEFRANRWSMPWHHVITNDERGEQLEEQWLISSYPTLLLVDENGVIVAMDEELRGERLLPTLERYLEEAGADEE